jgi:hypothetical protein
MKKGTATADAAELIESLRTHESLVYSDSAA